MHNVDYIKGIYSLPCLRQCIIIIIVIIIIICNNNVSHRENNNYIMIYLTRQLYDYPVSQTFGAQTEFDQELFSNTGTGMSAGTDASTQVDDKDVSPSPDRGFPNHVFQGMTIYAVSLRRCFCFFFLVIRLRHRGDAHSGSSDRRRVQASHARSAVRRRAGNESPATKSAVHAAHR